MITDETDPDLLSLQARIREAADRDDAAGMAAACLAHARLAVRIAEVKPEDWIAARPNLGEVLMESKSQKTIAGSQRRAIVAIAMFLNEQDDLHRASGLLGTLGKEFTYERDEALLQIVDRLARQNRLAEATVMVRSMSVEYLLSLGLFRIASAYVEQDKIEDARAFLTEAWSRADSIQDVGNKYHVLSAIALTNQLPGRLDAIIHLALQIDDSLWRNAALNGLLGAQVQSKLYVEARATVDYMDSPSDRDSALSTLALYHAYWGEVEASAKTASSIKERSLRIVALLYGKVERACQLVLEGKQTEGRQIFDRLRYLAKRTKNESTKFQYLMQTAEGQIKCGLHSDALQTVLQIGNASQRTAILSKIIEAQVSANDVNGARVTASLIANRREQIHVLSRIGAAEFRLGRTAAAVPKFSEAKEMALMVENVWERCGHLTTIASKQREAGKVSDAASTLEQVLMHLKEIENGFEWERADILIRVAIEHLNAYEWDEVMRTCEQIPINRPLHLPRLANAVAAIESREPDQGAVKFPHFKQLLIPAAYHSYAIYEISGQLAELYPEQATAIGRVVAGLPT